MWKTIGGGPRIPSYTSIASDRDLTGAAMADIRITLTCAGLIVVLAGLAGCTKAWPDPPPVDQAQYQKDYEKWRAGQQETARDASKLLGIWSLKNGDTPGTV